MVGPQDDAWAYFVDQVALLREEVIIGQKCKFGLRLPLQQKLGH